MTFEETLREIDKRHPTWGTFAILGRQSLEGAVSELKPVSAFQGIKTPKESKTINGGPVASFGGGPGEAVDRKTVACGPDDDEFDGIDTYDGPEVIE